MTTRRIKAANPDYAGTIAGTTFVDGVAEVDDETTAGRSLLLFAKRRGWGIAGVAAAHVPTVDQGKPLARWTGAECRAYLDAYHVAYPAGAKVEELRNAIRDAVESRTEGGAAPNGSAGRTSGTAAPIGAPGAINHDDADEAAKWAPALIAPAAEEDTTGQQAEGNAPAVDLGPGSTQNPEDADGATPAGVKSTEEPAEGDPTGNGTETIVPLVDGTAASAVSPEMTETTAIPTVEGQ